MTQFVSPIAIDEHGCVVVRTRPRDAASRSQSRAMSAVESVANVAIGYGVAAASQAVVFPWFGLHASLSDNLAIGGVFTVISLVRSFALRRFFEAMR